MNDAEVYSEMQTEVTCDDGRQLILNRMSERLCQFMCRQGSK